MTVELPFNCIGFVYPKERYWSDETT